MNKLHLLAASLGGAMLAAAPLLAQAKLPEPSPEAKAKADEAKAKTAWTDKVAGYKLCQAQDRVAAQYLKTAGKEAKPSATPCADPGPYVAPTPPLEAAGAHSPAATAATPPSDDKTAAEKAGTVKK